MNLCQLSLCPQCGVCPAITSQANKQIYKRKSFSIELLAKNFLLYPSFAPSPELCSLLKPVFPTLLSLVLKASPCPLQGLQLQTYLFVYLFIFVASFTTQGASTCNVQSFFQDCYNQVLGQEKPKPLGGRWIIRQRWDPIQHSQRNSASSGMTSALPPCLPAWEVRGRNELLLAKRTALLSETCCCFPCALFAIQWQQHIGWLPCDAV